MKVTRKRLEALETHSQSKGGIVTCVVIVDSDGKPLTRADPAARMIVVLPDNGRGDCSLLLRPNTDNL
jgi:hypothetical protein